MDGEHDAEEDWHAGRVYRARPRRAEDGCGGAGGRGVRGVRGVRPRGLRGSGRSRLGAVTAEGRGAGAAGAGPRTGWHRQPGGGPVDPLRPARRSERRPNLATAASRRPGSRHGGAGVFISRTPGAVMLAPAWSIEILLGADSGVNPPAVFTS
ncbi:hypothetical protein KPATCC21470_6802 [Kitasatospora purpeofusca]